MYTSCFEKEKEIGECSLKYDTTNNNNDYPIKINLTNDLIFSNQGKKIPIKIILSENEEVVSTANNTEPFENNSSGNVTPSPMQNFTENFIKFSNSNINNFTIGNTLY